MPRAWLVPGNGRLAVLAAVTLFAACLAGCRQGGGVDRLAADVENHGFVLDLPRQRVLYISGVYPKKSYLCFQGLSGSGRRRVRFPGYSLEGKPFLLRDGRTVLVAAKHYGDRFAEETTSAALLRVDLETGEILRSYDLAEEAQVRAFAQPAWSPAPVVALEVPGIVRLARLDGRMDLKTGGVRLDAARVGEVAVAEDRPMIAAVASDPAGAGALRLFAADTGRRCRDIGLQAPTSVSALGNGHWLVTVEDANGGGVVVDLNDTLQKVNPLLATPGHVESVVIGGKWLYAVSFSQQTRSAAGKTAGRERELRRVDLTGAEQARTFPWTRREGSLLGLDEKAGRLYYAAAGKEEGSVWAVPTDPSALESAGAAIDRPARVRLGLVYQALIGAMIAALIVGMVYLMTSGTGV